MLELYQAYADYTDMMAIFEDIVAGPPRSSRHDGDPLPGPRDRPDAAVAAGDPGRADRRARRGRGRPVDGGRASCGVVASGLGVPFEPWYGPGKLILEIYEKTTEAELWGPVFVCDYPQEVSPLARAHRSKPGYVERFEPIIAGPGARQRLQRARRPRRPAGAFRGAGTRERALGDEEAMTIDWDYLRALELGLPPTGGLGLGIDRLVMLYADVANIKEVLLFPALRPEEKSPDLTPGSTASGEPDA